MARCLLRSTQQCRGCTPPRASDRPAPPRISYHPALSSRRNRHCWCLLRSGYHVSCTHVKLGAIHWTAGFDELPLFLFFDGGSRGNPGPGGSGAVVVRIGASIAEVAICWILSMSYAARTTTNNQAEYSGLLEGLRACQRGGWTPLHVIGDSMMIIRQQTGRKPLHTAHLAPLYNQAGALLTCSVCSRGRTICEHLTRWRTASPMW